MTDTGGGLRIAFNAAYDRCPWCQHILCEKCDKDLNDAFPLLWFGCCSCGEAAQVEAYKVVWEATR